MLTLSPAARVSHFGDSFGFIRTVLNMWWSTRSYQVFYPSCGWVVRDRSGRSLIMFSSLIRELPKTSVSSSVRALHYLVGLANRCEARRLALLCKCHRLLASMRFCVLKPAFVCSQNSLNAFLVSVSSRCRYYRLFLPKQDWPMPWHCVFGLAAFDFLPTSLNARFNLLFLKNLSMH